MRLSLLALLALTAAPALGSDVDRDRKAKAALALAGTAAPKIVTAPAPRAVLLAYPEAYRRAVVEGAVLVAYVGCDKPHEARPGVLTARVPALQGYRGPAALVLYPAGSALYAHDLLPCPVADADLTAAVTAARKKIDRPKASDAAAPRPLEWDIRAEPEAIPATKLPTRDVRDSQCRVRRGNAQGSGTVVHRGEGWSLVLTCEHVVSAAPGDITVRCDGATLPALVVEIDKTADLAVLLVSADLPAVRVAETDPADGDSVTLVGMTSIVSRCRVSGRDTLGGREVLLYGTATDSDSGDSGGGVFHEGRLCGVHCGKVEGKVPHATATGPVRKLLARVLKDDGSLKAKPAPEPKAPQKASAAPQAGTLVTTSGRTLLPNGDGTYRYADAGPVVPSCPNGRCPQR